MTLSLSPGLDVATPPLSPPAVSLSPSACVFLLHGYPLRSRRWMCVCVCAKCPRVGRVVCARTLLPSGSTPAEFCPPHPERESASVWVQIAAAAADRERRRTRCANVKVQSACVFSVLRDAIYTYTHYIYRTNKSLILRVCILYTTAAVSAVLPLCAAMSCACDRLHNIYESRTILCYIDTYMSHVL